ncbi:MAG: hypothetical protein ACRDJE_18925 [Dehalococcoidia bacterium]
MTTDRSDRPVLHPSDLSPLERTYLGVLDTGMVSARLADDPSLRTDHVTAVCLALREGKPQDSYLRGDGVEPKAGFLTELTGAVRSLEERGVISTAPPPPDLILTPETPRSAPAGPVDFDQRPKIWDRYLAHECMEELFRDDRVYPFLMGKYQDSGDVWARLYRERPERFL